MRWRAGVDRHGPPRGICIGVDFSSEQLAFAKRLAEREGVKLELHHGDLADLSFVRQASIDLVFSVYAFGYVDDLNRCSARCTGC